MACIADHDSDAWSKYPEHRWVYNKLELSLSLGYCAGPSGIQIPHDGEYIIRPIYNLSGMGAGARRAVLKKGDTHATKPGEFWCEFFYGPNISVDYEWRSSTLTPVFAAIGTHTTQDLYRFAGWKLIDPPNYLIPTWIKNFDNVPRINIEFIDGKIIEIHLRQGVDFPHGATEIIPIWHDTSVQERQRIEQMGFCYVDNHDDADGHLPVSRTGFYYK